MLILTQTAGAIGTITLNQPARRNALSDEVVDQLASALSTFAADGIGVVVVRAEGPVFSAGARAARISTRRARPLSVSLASTRTSRR